MASVYNVKEHVLDAAHIREYARATSESQDEKLVLHVKQYTPKDNPNPRKGDVTIIGGHANGFPKELYEPLWEDLYYQAKQQGIRIRDIWIADCAWQGQSGMLNRAKLGNDPGWLDYSRDILHLINTVRPPRPIVAVGHSFGGNALVNVALINPRLFSALVLLDPVISRFSSTPGVLAQSPATASIYRRDEWPSRPAAAEAFRRSPFYRAWDDRVFDRWMRYGVVPKAAAAADDDGGPVTLATPTPQEVFTYLRPSWHAYDEKANKVTDRDLLPDLDEAATDNVHPSYPFYRPEPVSTLFRLTHVRPPVFYVFGRTSNLSSAELIQEKLDLTGAGAGGSGGKAHGRVAHVIGDYGHLIPLEAPGFCARSAAPWLKRELERWRSQEDEYEAWVSKSLREKTSISDEYKSHAPRPPKPGKDKAKI